MIGELEPFPTSFPPKQKTNKQGRCRGRGAWGRGVGARDRVKERERFALKLKQNRVERQGERHFF